MTMNDTDTKDTKKCRRCGDCCRNGGPALHHEDIALLRENHIGHGQIVTIRKGEPVLSPHTGQVEPAAHELIKLRGVDGDWTCLFFRDQPVACAIYQHRPIECRKLDCQAPEALLDIAGENLLTRHDLTNPNDPVRDLIAEHEGIYNVEELTALVAQLQNGQQHREHTNILNKLGKIVRTDLNWRQRTLLEHGIGQDFELFLFGRPAFLCLIPYGVRPVEDEDGVVSLLLD